MTYPPGVQLGTLTFSNPITVLGTDATKTEISIEPTASVVWTATGQPVDNFEETVSPSSGMPGSLTAPFVDQDGFADQAGSPFKNWAYVVTRRTYFGGKPKTVRKNWQPVTGQTVTDFDNLPGGSIGLPVSTPVVPVTSVGGFTGAVTAEQIASTIASRSARNILDFGVVRGTVASQTTAIKAALDAHPGESFYFPTGDYRLDASLLITKGNSLVLDNDARLYAGAAMDTLIDYTTTDGSFVPDKVLVGGILDGNLLASTVLSIQNILRFTLAQFTIRDGIHRGIKAGPEGAEIIARDGRIYNTGATNVSDNVAIEDLMGDNYWSDIIILDWTCAVKDAAASAWSTIHPWLSQGAQLSSRYPASTAFEVTSQSDLNLCYSDTYRTAYKLTSNGTAYTPPARLTNCRAYWAPTNLSAALAAANPAHVIDNTDGVGATVNTMMTGGHPEAPAQFLNGSGAKLTVRGTVNQGFTTGIADYINGVKQGDTMFTPTMLATTTAGTHAYALQNGRMTVAGDVVTYNIQVSATMGATIAGALRIGGLPVPTGATGVRPSSGVIGYASGVNIEGVFTGGGTSTFDLIPVYRTPTGAAEIWANDLQGDVVEVWVTIQANCYKD